MQHSHSALIVLVLTLQAFVAGQALASSEVCNHWLSGPLHQQSQGVDGNGIDASVVWMPPTGGEFLVVGGNFTTIGGMPFANIAAWDGASWRALGSGVNGYVHSLAVYNGHLIAGGRFTQAGGAPASLIARFDGASWHPLADGLVHTTTTSAAACYALTTFNGDLIAGGHFNRSGNTALVNLGRWNGSAWSVVGDIGTQGPSQYVKALRVQNNALYIGGQFNTAQASNQVAVFAENIVQLANGAFAALASGMQGGAVEALHSFNGDLIVAGSFSQASGLSANRIARWIFGGEFGGAWGTMGSGLGGTVIALQPFNGLLVAGGTFPGGVSAWNGSSWVGVGGGISGGASSDLNVFNGQLIVGGFFNSAGGVTATSIAQWSGAFWSALQTPVPQVFAFETLGSRFIAAGSFLQSTTNQTPAHNIIGWDGSKVTRVQNSICCGEGTNGTVRALKNASGSGTNQLIVGGDFTVAGGVAANRITQFTEPGFLPASWSAMGNGFNSSVYAIERFNNVTYAGGTFTSSGQSLISRVAQFNGTNWVALGSGVNGQVNAMKVFNGFLYAGGEFTTAGGVSTGCLARWNGSAWSTYSGLVGNILAGSVTALEVHNNRLYIGNTFGSGFHVLEYTGTSTSLVGTANGIISSLKSDGQHLYVLGGYTTVAGVTANRVARWNSTQGWSDVEGGTNEVVNTLGLFRGEIHVGLGITFGLDDAAPQPGKGWVRYSPTGAPWISSNPIVQTVNCGQTATFTSQPAMGFSFLFATWHRNGVALSDGPTGTGSTISGAHSTTLTILNPSSADAGSYACVFTNLCGAATSSAATLTLNNCCAGDIDNDTDTDFDDLVRCITSWGDCPALPGDCSADVNGTGAVNIDDLVVVITSWGPCS